jgi:malonyl-CoA/methylmalonyl-CoA synthetase
MNKLELVRRAELHAGRVALQEGARRVSYRGLLDRSAALARCLLGNLTDLSEERVALYLPAGVDYVVAQWAVWRAGGIVVPLNVHASLPELEYALTSAVVTRLLTGRSGGIDLADVCERNGVEILHLHELGSSTDISLPDVSAERRAMMVFTSGTTSKPKGVVSTHLNIQAQVECLVREWGWRADDRIPGFLPLHHVHGIVNVLTCALWIGASVDMQAEFDIDRILERVAQGRYTVFMAVPTIYVKLIHALDALAPESKAAVCGGFRRMRLMVSGSAALPVKVHQAWFALTGQVLLERYGMTEIGMALSNPLHGERRPGAVGQPLPGVELQLVNESGERIDGENEPGEIRVRGPAVFKEYWKNPEATRAAFSDGWFMTGDMAVLEDGYYRIMGRLSVDIIKSGGYKLSALEIEDALLAHPDIAECAVIGIEDGTWGEVVAAAAVLNQGASLDLADLKEWMKDRVSPYKIPKQLMIVAELPRNAMGKVTKPAVSLMFADG